MVCIGVPDPAPMSQQHNDNAEAIEQGSPPVTTIPLQHTNQLGEGE